MMRTLSTISFLSIIILAAAESHTISFINKCGFGTPTLIEGEVVLSTGGTVTVNGPLIDAIAYLQTGKCQFNGGGCTTVELSLSDPTTPGTGCTADITLVPPHTFSVTTGFNFINGCSNGIDCTNSNCPGAIVSPGSGEISVCETSNCGIQIKFCD